METIIAYILGILTVFLVGMAVGMFVVMRKTQSLQKNIDSINVELNNTSGDIYRLVETERKEIDSTIGELYREIEKHNDDINRTMDSRFNKMENKLTQTDSKTLLKG
jgi:predicted PurR-regulated permease PerM